MSVAAIIEENDNSNCGYDARQDKYCDMVKDGIHRPHQGRPQRFAKRLQRRHAAPDQLRAGRRDSEGREEGGRRRRGGYVLTAQPAPLSGEPKGDRTVFNQGRFRSDPGPALLGKVNMPDELVVANEAAEEDKVTELTTLGEVLSNDSRFSSQNFLYLPMDEVWQLETKCAVLAQSDLVGVPHVAQQNGLACALEMAAVQDLVANARLQLASAGLSQLLQAFLFYYDNDAFITF